MWFKGIEIGHPIYSLLFSNIIVSFSGTVLNLIVLVLSPFHTWIRVALFSNVISMHFHMISWTLISVLRYLYIEHKVIE